jgi:hypothetical protein
LNEFKGSITEADIPENNISSLLTIKDIYKYGNYFYRKKISHKEVYLESYDEEVKANPLYVVDYVTDIFKHLKETEVIIKANNSQSTLLKVVILLNCKVRLMIK